MSLFTQIIPSTDYEDDDRHLDTTEFLWENDVDVVIFYPEQEGWQDEEL